MKRRDFITLLGGAAAAWPLAARAQQAAVPVIGVLISETLGRYADRLAAFHRGLKQGGFVEGGNLAVEYRWADGHADRLLALAADLVRRKVTVIVAFGTPPALAAKAATSTIPIVFNTGGDPVELGLVSSLNRPGGNLTGVTSLNLEIGPKRLELLHELVPAARIIALLVNPTNPNGATLSRAVQAAASTLGLQLYVLNASNEPDFELAFATLAQVQAGGLVIATDGYFLGQSGLLAAQVLRHRVPAIFAYHEFAAAGGLMS
jgi:putative ABC transport system substrate-binding protein